MPSSLAPYSLLPIGAGPEYTAPVAAPQNCLFLSSRTIDRASVVAGTEVSGLPASYLADIQPAKKWRTTGNMQSLTLASWKYAFVADRGWG